MTQFNAIGNPILSTGIGRLYGVDAPRVGMISPDIQLTTSPWERDEFWGLLGGGLGIGNFSVAAVAGQISQAQLVNPANSGVLLLLEEFYIHAPAATTSVNFGITKNLGTVTTNWGNRDTRRIAGVSGPSGLSGRVAQDNGGGAAFLQAWGLSVPYLAGLQRQVMGVVIAPGFAFNITTISVNTDLRGWFVGRERPAPQPELSLV